MFDRGLTSTQDLDALDEPTPELRRVLLRLRTQLTHYVARRRAAGVPIERVLPEVKCLVRESQSVERWADPAGALMAQIVGWSITAYYDEPELRHVPRFY
jgi:hypothetical protein